jgi:hypothetical protein
VLKALFTNEQAAKEIVLPRPIIARRPARGTALTSGLNLMGAVSEVWWDDPQVRHLGDHDVLGFASALNFPPGARIENCPASVPNEPASI